MATKPNNFIQVDGPHYTGLTIGGRFRFAYPDSKTGELTMRDVTVEQICMPNLTYNRNGQAYVHCIYHNDTDGGYRNFTIAKIVGDIVRVG